MILMKSLPREQINELWDKYWNEIKFEWFKLEVLQDYSAEDDDPSLQAWLKGDKQRSLELLDDEDPEFTSDCRQKTNQGTKLTRVHIVEEPLSSYMQWEIEYYKRISIPARGEQIYLVNAKDLADLQIPSADLILFDDRHAVLNNYDKNGRMIGAEFYDEDDDLSSFLDLKNSIKLRAKKLEID
jgi:hypothetical protein